jgi:fibronectin type 3 domain-containing protein
VRCARRWLAVAFALPFAACATLEAATDRLAGGRAPAPPMLHEGDAAGLPAPQGLRATSGELRAIPLRWDPLLDDDVGGYVLEHSGEREGPFARLALLPARTSTVFVDRGPEAGGSAEAAIGDGETRFYRVRGFTRDGETGAFSEVVAATTAPRPDPPEGLRAFSLRPREVPLSWEPSRDPSVAGYAVERSPAPEGPFEVVAQLADRWQTSWVDAGLGDLRVFYYRVVALNRAAGRGEPSAPVRAVTKPEPLPPLGLREAGRRLGANRLAWEPNVEPDLAGYRLLRVREARTEPEAVAVLGPDATRAIDGSVGPGERVTYRLVALDREGRESAPSAPVTVESESYGISATPRADGVHLEWKERRAEGWRRARVLLEGWPRNRELAVVEGGRYVHAEAQPGRRYRYRVVLERPDGAAAPLSEAVEVRVPDA